MMIFTQMATDIVKSMYHAGLGTFSDEEVCIAKHQRDRKIQRSLVQFIRPEICFEVRMALLAAGQKDP
jgi:hypothetical protein